jgi:hypothetical protein
VLVATLVLAEAVVGTFAAAAVFGALAAVDVGARVAVIRALATAVVVGARADAAPAREAEHRCTGAGGRNDTN